MNMLEGAEGRELFTETKTFLRPNKSLDVITTLDRAGYFVANLEQQITGQKELLEANMKTTLIPFTPNPDISPILVEVAHPCELAIEFGRTTQEGREAK